MTERVFYELGCVCHFKTEVPKSQHFEDVAVCDGRCQRDPVARREVAEWARRRPEGAQQVAVREEVGDD